MRNNFFKTIDFNDAHSTGPRTRPESVIETQRFRARLRKFIGPQETRSIWKNLGDEYELSEQLKDFTNIAKKARENYIIEVFYKNKPAFSFKPIPVTKEESIAQEHEANLTKAEILCKIQSLLEQMSENIQQKYHAIKSKNKNDLLNILQEVRFLFNADNEVHDFVERPEIMQQE